MKAILVIAGAAIGFGVGVATRPTILGFQLPMSLLTSSHPFDAEPKSMLISHLLTTTGIGLLVGVALVAVTVVATKKQA